MKYIKETLTIGGFALLLVVISISYNIDQQYTFAQSSTEVSVNLPDYLSGNVIQIPINIPFLESESSAESLDTNYIGIPQLGYAASSTELSVESPGVLSGNLIQVPIHIPVN